jgi:hypothetical protein
MTDETKNPSTAEIKTAITAQMVIMKEFATHLDRAFPGKNILETFTDLQMRHHIPSSVYRDPWIARYTAEGVE